MDFKDFCSMCNYYDIDYGCLHDDRMCDCPLYYDHYPNYLQEIDDNIRSFEKSIDYNKKGDCND